ncbi:signal peptidase I [Vannielia litorea]|uniref:Signal peptidase I n=1 Tax=Vannielia litorea TaxID=1217970 RepID=A0A1N6IM06_9RHOB|nr:signal peptidase I [Vannielia litorea]SIO33051.1 signal peptidase I [Vannielia litorea]
MRRVFYWLFIGLGAALVFGLPALALALRLIWAPSYIPAGSMKPTLLVGDYFFVNERLPRPIERGDVVVFRHPVSGADFVKRVVALGGDTIAMRGGVPVLNGEPLTQEPLGDFEELMAPQGPHGSLPRCANGQPGPGQPCLKSLLREHLPGGRSYRVLNAQTNGPLDDTAEFTVPPRHIFVMGDNRDNSLDSRVPQSAGGIGMVPLANIRGQADRVLFSAAGSWLYDFRNWRSDRYGKVIE